MNRLEICECFEQGCYRCAIELVIKILGFDTQCDCFKQRGKKCQNRCGRMYLDIASAFSRSSPPYEEWARRHANNVGMKKVKLVIFQADGTENEVDLSAGDMTISANQSHYSFAKQDLILAADELAKSIKEDPISHNSAKIIVARLIQAGEPIPESLREWASDLLEGKLQQPKARGKLLGASAARDRAIYNLLKKVTAFGLKATSSNRENGGSACHAIAQAFQLLGLQPDSYSSIEKIWLKGHKLKGFDSRWD